MTQAMSEMDQFAAALHDFAEHECDTARAKLVGMYAAALADAARWKEHHNTQVRIKQRIHGWLNEALAERPAEPPVSMMDALNACHALLESVAEQQAMTDDSWRVRFAEIKRAALATRPTSEPEKGEICCFPYQGACRPLCRFPKCRKTP